ncbi:GGDEF domain-containing protein [Pseudofrankia asymbiotica]|uniref:GGDEF domain-containing protein n=1 Tax=Pseudofrankia asymbiotica TaxID=1834516 RepID=A0A1V2IHD0_9ACTN|nr:GGDEF domain-containing protein [Pseudofrankia asymbiotica]ONH32445.1 hypothetical protein BL253_05295 [Pseudofrankia asymbiotica]
MSLDGDRADGRRSPAASADRGPAGLTRNADLAQGDHLEQGAHLAQDPAEAAAASAAVARVDGPVSERTYRRMVGGTALLIVAALLPLDFLTGRRLVVFQGVALVACSVFAVTLAAVAIVRSRGVERRWRLLVSSGLLSTLVGAVYWSIVWADPGRSLLRLRAEDGIYLLAPLLALIGLLTIPTTPADRSGAQRAPPLAADDDGAGRLVAAVVVALDGLVIVVSMFLIAWVAVLRHVAESGVSGWPFVVALAYPLSEVVLVVVALLLLTFRRPHNGRAMWLLTVGLLFFSISETTLVYLTVRGPFQVQDTALYWIGLVFGPPVLALGMVIPMAPARSPRVWLGRIGGEDLYLWVHAYLPYLPVGVASLLVVVPAVRGEALQGLTLQLSIVLATLVAVRQMVTVAQNTRLLASLRATQRGLRHQAQHDPLTGLANRSLFTAEVDRAVDAHRTAGRPLVVLFCDLDDFKMVNDTLGHHAGDELLRAVAGRLRGAVRQEDLTARLGGDEFAVLMRGLPDGPRAMGENTAARIQEALRPAFQVHGRRRDVQASVGVAVADTSSPVASTEELLHRADQAMYAAKNRRRRARRTTRGPRRTARR